MSQFINKLKDILLGVDIEDEEDDIEEYDDMEESVLDKRSSARPEVSSFPTSNLERGVKSPSLVRHPSNYNNVVDLHKKTQVNVCLPKTIEDARAVIDNTKSQVISIINLDGVDNETSQRIADFLSGSVDALDGTIRRLSDEMFIIGPYGVNISGYLNEEVTKEVKSSGAGLAWASSVFK